MHIRAFFLRDTLCQGLLNAEKRLSFHMLHNVSNGLLDQCKQVCLGYRLMTSHCGAVEGSFGAMMAQFHKPRQFNPCKWRSLYPQ
jgi:hypothetical protein